MKLTHNTVYDNINKIPYYNKNYEWDYSPIGNKDCSSYPACEQELVEGCPWECRYGKKTQDYIIDGMGVYVSARLGRTNVITLHYTNRNLGGVTTHPRHALPYDCKTREARHLATHPSRMRVFMHSGRAARDAHTHTRKHGFMKNTQPHPHPQCTHMIIQHQGPHARTD